MSLFVQDPAELEVGISAYRNDAPGFSAVLKARYSDFLVREVALDGTMARLECMEPRFVAFGASSVEDRDDKHGGDHDDEDTAAADEPDSHGDKISIPPCKKQKLAQLQGSKDDEGEAPASSTLDWDLIKTELKELIDENSSQSVVEFLRQPQTEATFHALPAIDSKELRRSLHEWIRLRLEPVARADTVNSCVRIWHKRNKHLMPNFQSFRDHSSDSQTGHSRREQQRRNRLDNNPKGGPPQQRYLRFVLYKENMDTNTAVHFLQNSAPGRNNSRRRNHPPAKLRLGYAGMKDKRGITCQFVTIKVDGHDDPPPDKPPRIVEALCRRWNGPHGGLCGGGRGGGHTQGKGSGILRVGNFGWVHDELKLGDLRGNRFDVVLRNVKDAASAVEAAAEAFRATGFVNYFGLQRFGKYADTHLVGMAVLRGDYEAAIDVILSPKADEATQFREARVEWQERFKKLDQNEDRRGAEQRCASSVAKKLGRFMGTEIAVLQSLSRHPLDYRRAFSCVTKTLRMMFLHAVQSFIWNHVASHRIQSMSRDGVVSGDLIVETVSAGGGGSRETVRAVSDEDVASSRFTLEDVVLPLIGARTMNPRNECSEVITHVLHTHGLTLDMFSRLNDRELDVSGDYRKLLCHPKDVDFEVLQYDDPLQPLIQTDLMKIHSIELTTNPKAADERPMLHAVQVGFTLPASSYATIALRELMKHPTSSDYQSEQKLGPCQLGS